MGAASQLADDDPLELPARGRIVEVITDPRTPREARMPAAETLPAPTEKLCWTEMQARFPDRYVTVRLDEDDISGGPGAIRGRVVSHGWCARTLVEASKDWWGPDDIVGLYYTGVPDEDRDALRAAL